MAIVWQTSFTVPLTQFLDGGQIGNSKQLSNKIVSFYDTAIKTGFANSAGGPVPYMMGNKRSMAKILSSYFTSEDRKNKLNSLKSLRNLVKLYQTKIKKYRVVIKTIQSTLKQVSATKKSLDQIRILFNAQLIPAIPGVTTSIIVSKQIEQLHQIAKITTSDFVNPSVAVEKIALSLSLIESINLELGLHLIKPTKPSPEVLKYLQFAAKFVYQASILLTSSKSELQNKIKYIAVHQIGILTKDMMFKVEGKASKFSNIRKLITLYRQLSKGQISKIAFIKQAAAKNITHLIATNKELAKILHEVGPIPTNEQELQQLVTIKLQQRGLLEVKEVFVQLIQKKKVDSDLLKKLLFSQLSVKNSIVQKYLLKIQEKSAKHQRIVTQAAKYRIMAKQVIALYKTHAELKTLLNFVERERPVAEVITKYQGSINKVNQLISKSGLKFVLYPSNLTDLIIDGEIPNNDEQSFKNVQIRQFIRIQIGKILNDVILPKLFALQEKKKAGVKEKAETQASDKARINKSALKLTSVLSQALTAYWTAATWTTPTGVNTVTLPGQPLESIGFRFKLPNANNSNDFAKEFEKAFKLHANTILGTYTNNSTGVTAPWRGYN